MIKSITVTEVPITLREPFITSLRRVESYPVIRLRIELESGEVGIGECVATPQISGDSHEAILTELNSLVGNGELPPDRYSGFLPSAKAAIDLALWNIDNEYPALTIKSDVTVPIASLEAIPALLQERIAAGFTSFKVKVGESTITELISRIALIREIVGADALIRIDPNQAWDFDFARRALIALTDSGANIEYVEQPLPKDDLLGHKRLADESAIPLMADESCFSLSDLDRLLEVGGFKYLNVKLLKSGGIRPALELARRATAAGLQVSVGSMMEGEIGIKAAIYLAHEIAPLAVHDLDAAWWFNDTSLRYQGSSVSS